MPQLCERRLTCRREGNALILTLAGPEIHGEAYCAALLRELLGAIAANARPPRVVLHLGEVSFITSLGLAVLLRFRRRLLRRGGRLVLCAPAPRVADLLEVTHLTGDDRSSRYPFEVAPDEATALSLLRSRP